MTGHISLWRHRTRSEDNAGFHLSADRAGCDQLLVLLGNLARARSSQIGNVVLDPVSSAMLAVPGVRGDAITAFRHWELLADPRFPPERLHFAAVNDRVRLELSPVQVESIVAGLQDIRERRGGYAIGDEGDHQLWFWWQEAD